VGTSTGARAPEHDTTEPDDAVRPDPISIPGTLLDVVVEVRLAVVMYGGVSLSIYMNGVAQELFHLVRATAPARPAGATALPDARLTGSGRAYRALGPADPRGP